LNDAHLQTYEWEKRASAESLGGSRRGWVLTSNPHYPFSFLVQMIVALQTNVQGYGMVTDTVEKILMYGWVQIKIQIDYATQLPFFCHA